MEIRHILIIMFVVFGLFALANWFYRPKKLAPHRRPWAPEPGRAQA